MPNEIEVICKCGSCGSCSCCPPTAHQIGCMAFAPVTPATAIGTELAIKNITSLIASKIGFFCATVGGSLGAGLAAGAVAYFAGYGIAKSCENDPESHSINDESNSLLASAPAQASQMHASYLVSVSVQPPPTYGSPGMSNGGSNKVD